MILSGKHLLHGNLAGPTRAHGRQVGQQGPVGLRVPMRVAASLHTLWIYLRMRDDVDVWDILCVLSKNEYTQGIDAHNIMEMGAP
jgi:hypothetical protein